MRYKLKTLSSVTASEHWHAVCLRTAKTLLTLYNEHQAAKCVKPETACSLHNISEGKIYSEVDLLFN